MKFSLPTPTRRTVIIACLGVAVIAGSLYVYSLLSRPSLPQLKDEATPAQKQTEQKTNATTKQDFLDSQTNQAAKSSPQSAQQAKPAPVPTTAAHISMSIEQTDQAVTALIKLKEQGFSSGSCQLTVSSGSHQVTQQAAIIYQPEYSTCAGFSLPRTALPKGVWRFTLSVTPLNGAPLTKTIDKEVK